MVKKLISQKSQGAENPLPGFNNIPDLVHLQVVPGNASTNRYRLNLMIVFRVYDGQTQKQSIWSTHRTHLGVHVRTELLRIVVVQCDHPLDRHVRVDVAPLITADAAHARAARA